MMDQKYRVRVNRDPLVSTDRRSQRKKRWIVWGLIAGVGLIALIVILVIIGGRDDKPVETGGAELTLVIERGDVQVQEPGDEDFRDAIDGMTLAEGTHIRTDDEALAALELESGSVMRLNQESRAQLNTINAEQFALELTEGQVWVLVTGDQPPATSVATAAARVQAQSTTFDVLYEDELTTVMAVEDTSVVTALGDQVESDDESTNASADLGKLLLEEDQLTEVDADDLPQEEDDFIVEDISDDIRESFWFRWNQEKDQERLDQLAGREDDEGPALVISSPEDDTETDEQSIDVSGTTDISASVTVNDKDVDNDLGTFTTTVDLEEGENIISVVATDPAGNETTKDVTVVRTPGGPDAVSVSLDTSESGSILITWGESDADSFGSYTIKRDEEVISRITDQDVTEYRDEGVSAGETYTYNVCVVDSDGQEACSQDERATVTGDPNQEPSVSVTGPANGARFSGGTEVSFTAEGSDPDGDTLTYTWDFGDGVSTTGQNVSHTYSVTSSDQNLTVTVSVTDRAGATSTSSIAITITP